jgi:predicted phage terminase large subunit-like protein
MNKLYLVFYIEGRWKSPELKRKIEWIAEKFLQGPRSKIYIENKANARATKDDLEERTDLNIILENIKGDKMERVENAQSILESRRVCVPESDSWTDLFLQKCLGFPLMDHDEPVDCLTGAIRTILNNKTGVLQFARPGR